jgi:hypothetical protein
VGAPVEHEILAGSGLLKSRRFAKTAGDVGGNGAARLQDVWFQRRERGERAGTDCDGEKGCAHISILQFP